MLDTLTLLCLSLGVASLLVAGVFQAFSDFVMRSLAAARPAAGAEVMQMINREVFGSAFLAMFLALAPATLGLAVYAVLTAPAETAGWTVAAAALYLVATFAVTILGNVPMNERLDRLSGAEAETYWRTYSVAWTRLNHLRTAGAIGAGLCLILAALAAT